MRSKADAPISSVHSTCVQGGVPLNANLRPHLHLICPAMNRERANASQSSPRLAHAAWAAVGIIVCLLLVLTGQKGHPPAVIFLPHALVVWAVGHGLIWGVQRLAARGRRIVTATEGQRWPVGLRLAVVGTGAAALVGVAQVIGTGLEGRWFRITTLAYGR
jgi:hypothetical protein